MYRETVILISSLLAISILDTVNSQESKTIYSSDAQPEDVQLLSPISWQTALPVVLFQTTDNLFIQYPQSLEKAQIKDGRLVKGTTFLPPPSETKLFKDDEKSPTPPQLFLCPNPDIISDNCLAPTEFAESQVLECKREPTPVLEEFLRKTKCGSTKSGLMMRFLYKTCLYNPLKMIPQSVETYTLCYDGTANNVLFVDYNLTSVKLFSEILLQREREIILEPNKGTHGPINHAYYTYLDNLKLKYAQYEFQFLVPTDNMALATWRKTTYEYVNLALQHRKLLDLWDEVNNHIRINAEESIHNSRKITTGVFPISDKYFPTERGEDQMYNIWVTTVVNNKGIKRHGKSNLNSIQGIAILMNNFISENETPATDEKTQYIDELCGKSICVKTLIDKFKKVGGEVRCCGMSDTILELIWGAGTESVEFDDLVIRGITSEDLPNWTTFNAD